MKEEKIQKLIDNYVKELILIEKDIKQYEWKRMINQYKLSDDQIYNFVRNETKESTIRKFVKDLEEILK